VQFVDFSLNDRHAITVISRDLAEQSLKKLPPGYNLAIKKKEKDSALQAIYRDFSL